jgi:LIM domain
MYPSPAPPASPTKRELPPAPIPHRRETWTSTRGNDGRRPLPPAPRFTAPNADSDYDSESGSGSESNESASASVEEFESEVASSRSDVEPTSPPRRPQYSEDDDDDDGAHRRRTPPRWQPSVISAPTPMGILLGQNGSNPRSFADLRGADININGRSHPPINIESPAPLGGRDTKSNIPLLQFPDADGDGRDDEDGEDEGSSDGPVINVQGPPMITIDEPPTINVSGPAPEISISGPNVEEPHNHNHNHDPNPATHQRNLPAPPKKRGKGLVCGGCGDAISGRIVSAMGMRWHPACFKCTVCEGLLEHVSSYERDGRPYCHLDYHEVGLFYSRGEDADDFLVCGIELCATMLYVQDGDY